MATGTRPLWNGAINFGLVHVPVSLHPATREGGIDFDWLDRRTLDRVGYKRVNKKTGREVAREDIVRGVKTEDGSHVVLGDDEIRAAFPRSTQSIDIETFVPAGDVPFVYLDRPYYLVPAGEDARPYALLREALARTGRVGLARVVLHTRQHLAALVPAGPVLVLDLLRWDADVRDRDRLDLPAEGGKAAGVGRKELRMAVRLVEEMSGEWQPEKFRDSFRDDVMALVEKKAKAGAKERVEPVERPPAEGRGAQIIDLADLLRRSLRDGGAAPPAGKKVPAGAAGKAAGKKAAGKKAAGRKAAGRKAPAKKAPAAKKAKAASRPQEGRRAA